MTKTKIADLSELKDREPAYALVANVDLVVIRYDNEVSVLYGRCHHRGALLADGYIDGENLICGVHYWDYRYDTGVSEYQNTEHLAKFNAWIQDDSVYVDEDEIREWNAEPTPYHRDEYQETTKTSDTPEEPYVAQIQELARNGLSKMDTTVKPRRWVCYARTYRIGTHSSLWWRSCTKHRILMKCQSGPS